jgi:hypothetical protein
VHEHKRWTLARKPVSDGLPVDLELPDLHTVSVPSGRDEPGTRSAGAWRSRNRQTRSSPQLHECLIGQQSRRTRYRPDMAQRKQTEDQDVISRLADAGEGALRTLVDIPRRIVVGVAHAVEERMQDVATRVRAIDPLDRRVSEIEKRIESLEKPMSTTTRRASTRAKPSTARRARTAAATAPEQAEHDLAGSGDARAEAEPERDEAQAGDEGKPAE